MQAGQGLKTLCPLLCRLHSQCFSEGEDRRLQALDFGPMQGLQQHQGALGTCLVPKDSSKKRRLACSGIDSIIKHMHRSALNRHENIAQSSIDEGQRSSCISARTWLMMSHLA